MTCYWRNCGYRHGNFGDELTPMIVGHCLGVHVIERATEMKDADLISIGSILNEIPQSYTGTVWGAGAMFQESEIDIPCATIKAVRGPLSRKRVKYQAHASIALGDPAILADLLVQHTPTRKEFSLSIMPHYADMNDEELSRFLKKNPSVHVIDPCKLALAVLVEILASDRLLSSCLHGLIVADSLGVPNAWVRLSDKLAGGTFKFRDYYANYGEIDPVPLIMNEGRPIDNYMKACRVNDCAVMKKDMLASFPKELPKGDPS